MRSERTDFFLGELLLEGSLHLSRTFEIGSEGFLDDDAVDSVADVVVAFEMLSDVDEDARREGHVEDAIAAGGVLVRFLNFVEGLFELEEGSVVVVLAGDVGAEGEEFGELGFEFGRGRLDVFGYSLLILLSSRSESAWQSR